MKKSLTIAAAIALMAPAMASAQNLLAGKSVHLFGEAKTWTKIVNDAEETFTVNVDDLQKLTVEPQNTSNIFLFPETGGGWATDENKAIGIQGFYVDLEESTAIGTVSTTWEGAAANAYNIYVTEDVPTTALLEGEATYSATGLGQYTANTAVLPEGTKGRYVVFQPTDATNWGWGVKIRSISAAAPQEVELTSFTVSPSLLISNESDVTVTCKDQLGLPIDATITVSDNASFVDGKLTINEGNSAVFTAKVGNVELTYTVYLVPEPTAPNAADIKKAIFTSSMEGKVSFEYYNGGAEVRTRSVFENGEEGLFLEKALCVFVYNTDLGGSWNNITGSAEATAELGKSLRFSIFATNDCDVQVWYSDNGVSETLPLIGGQWNNLEAALPDAAMPQISFRFGKADEKDMAQNVVLANIYTTGASVPTGVSAVAEVEGAVNVYNMQGVLLKENVNAAEALEGLAKGMYVVGNKKVVK